MVGIRPSPIRRLQCSQIAPRHRAWSWFRTTRWYLPNGQSNNLIHFNHQRHSHSIKGWHGVQLSVRMTTYTWRGSVYLWSYIGLQTRRIYRRIWCGTCRTYGGIFSSPTRSIASVCGRPSPGTSPKSKRHRMYPNRFLCWWSSGADQEIARWVSVSFFHCMQSAFYRIINEGKKSIVV